MKTPVIVANWKMNPAPQAVRALAGGIGEALSARPPAGTVVICPPALYLPEVAAALAGSGAAIGGQDCHWEEKGAFTGDISAAMLKGVGCEYVIVGHSERRAGHQEGNTILKRKAEAALAYGLIPIVCVGESAEQRASGKAIEAVVEQLKASIPRHSPPATRHFILAYEPIWAIGSGQTPTSEDIRAMHCAIREAVGDDVPILYGGSVKAGNAAEILATDCVDGVLVGGASLEAEEFLGIVAAA